MVYGRPITAEDYLQKIKRIATSTQTAKHRMRNSETASQTVHRLSSALHLIVEFCQEYEEKKEREKDV